MKLFKRMKDGGPESSVTGFWLIEAKRAFSVVLLRFEGESRTAFHSHAFHCLSWVVRGALVEEMRDGRKFRLGRSWRPHLTTRKDFHKVRPEGQTAWVLSIRGPWASKWDEYLEDEQRFRTLGSGRVEQ